jgi:hypothetical protein
MLPVDPEFLALVIHHSPLRVVKNSKVKLLSQLANMRRFAFPVAFDLREGQMLSA